MVNVFVTLEGPEGAGKSTVIVGLADRFKAEGREVVVTREPGAGEFGREVRRLLLEGGDLGAEAELFLFLADRAEHMRTLIKPALVRGAVVLCDRHADSTVVYQGYARGLDVEWLRGLNLVATQGMRPEKILLLDLPVEVGLSRVTKGDRLDREPVEFHQKVRDGFLTEAGIDSERWAVVDAEMESDKVLEACWVALKGKN